MSPAAGGAAPGQSSAAVIAPAITGQEPDRAAARRDPPGKVEGADPANAAARKTAWGVPPPTPATAAATNLGGGGVIGGDASWPALVESKRGKTASSHSLKPLNDGSGPSAQEDPVAASVPSHPVAEPKPISSGSNPTPTLPANADASASLQQNGSTTQPKSVWRSGSCRAVNSSGSGGDGNRNGGSLGSGSSCNSSNEDGCGSLNDNVPGSNTSGNGNDISRNAFANNNWNNNIRGVGSRSSNVSGDGNSRNSGGSSSQWNNNFRNSNGSSNGGQGRSGYRGRRDHERGDNFSPRNYPRVSVMPYHQQHPAVYQPGSFHQPPPLVAAHFMTPHQFVTYAPPFAYHGDVPSYPLYLPPMEQLQNMNLVRTPIQPSWFPQDQSNLQEDIKMQIEFYFSTNNLCHDTFLRRHMNDQGWVSIDLILGFNRMRAFTGLVDTNYILDAIRGSESLEVQGNNVRRRNDWAEWLLH